MTAYLINHLRIPGGVPNEEGLSYLERVEGTVNAHGGRYLAQGEVEVVEGTWAGSAVVIEFPSMIAARSWYHSREYQAIAPLRINNSISDMVFLEGVGPDFTVGGFAQQVRAAIASAGGSA